MRVSLFSDCFCSFLQCLLRSDLCMHGNQYYPLSFQKMVQLPPKFRYGFFVSVVWHVVTFKVLCVCVQGVKSGSFEKPSSAQSVPLLLVVENALSPAAEFLEEAWFVCFVVVFVLHLCLCQLPLTIQHVGFLDQSSLPGLWRTSNNKQNQQRTAPIVF